MELTSMQMYWLLMLDNINFLFGVGFVVCIVLLFFGMVFTALEETWFDLKKVWVFLSVLIFMFLILGSFTPRTKQMAAILVVPKIVNNEQLQQMPDKILNLGLEWLEEFKPEKGEKEEK